MEQEFEETLNSDMMRRIYFLLDMSLLRRESRASHIENLNCAIARCWAASYRPNMSFGFKLYDSELGEYALQALLRGVAAELRTCPRWCYFRRRPRDLSLPHSLLPFLIICRITSTFAWRDWLRLIKQ